MRKHYMTLCIRDNVEITHIEKNGEIEVTFETAVKDGFKSAVFNIKGETLMNDGYNASELDFFSRFVLKNEEGIVAESKGLI